MNAIEHQPDRDRFAIAAEQGEALLEYRFVPMDGGATGVDFTYTYVPPALRGQGLAERLVRRGLSWAREEGYPIRASCWYVAKFLR